MNKEQEKKTTVYLEDLQDQIASTTQRIDEMQKQVAQVNTVIEQERGILIHTKFLLDNYRFPNRPEAPKPELEVAK